MKKLNKFYTYMVGIIIGILVSKAYAIHWSLYFLVAIPLIFITYYVFIEDDKR